MLPTSSRPLSPHHWPTATHHHRRHKNLSCCPPATRSQCRYRARTNRQQTGKSVSGHPWVYPLLRGARSVFVDVVFTIQLVHGMGVHHDQHQEDVDGTLLRKPETQLETEELDGVELVDKQDGRAVGHGEPDH